MIVGGLVLTAGAVGLLASWPAAATTAGQQARAAFVVAPGAMGEGSLRCPPGTRVSGDRTTVSPAGAEVVQLSSTSSGAPQVVAISVMNADAIDVTVAASADCVPLP